MPEMDPLANWKKDVKFSNNVYIYPFHEEVNNADIEVIFTIPKNLDIEGNISAAIPPLKYNKETLFMLSQDDCSQSAFCYTLAAINGWPIPDQDDQFYNLTQLRFGDFPPFTHNLGNELASTDGAGNSVRFSFTSTISPEDVRMNHSNKANPNLKKDYVRFKMQSMLSWDEVRQMLNHGVSIAFHDMKTDYQNNQDTLIAHFEKSQEIVLDKLNGRGVKFLVEPNGNKNYINAGRRYPPLQIFTSTSGAEEIYPFRINTNLTGKLVNRYLPDIDFISFKQKINSISHMPIESRPAIGMLMHRTTNSFVSFLKWLNDNYGKDGDDSIWATSLEEYFEYTHYRLNASISISATSFENYKEVKINISIPTAQYFYYPSFTLNIHGLPPQVISYLVNNADAGISVNSTVTGLSVAGKTLGFSYTSPSTKSNYESGEHVLMLNINCRKNLLSNAQFFVNEFINYSNSSQTNSLLLNLTYNDALYFVNQLKTSPAKEQLLQKLSAK